MKLLAYLDTQGRTDAVGHVFVHVRRGRQTGAFSYDNDYLSQPTAYAIDPALPLGGGTWPTGGPLPRAFLDAAPDRWGRNLIDRRAAAQPAKTGVAPRRLTDVDYLLGVSDAARQGALRFRTSPEGPFEHPGDEVPKLVALPALVAASRSVILDDADAAAALKTLLDVGSASLGGARPKASVQDGGRLYVAKFPHPHDEWAVMAWEATALDIAVRAGVQTPPHRLVDVGGQAALLVERFDRTPDGQRVGYISALTLCEADDGDRRDYLDVAERLGALSAAPQADLNELWRRIMVGIAINNTDDHLRNHGLVRVSRGWRLSPVFDINPNLDTRTAHVSPIAGATASQPAAAALMDTAEFFGLTATRAKEIVHEIAEATMTWEAVAAANNIPQAEIRRFAPVFSRGIQTLTSIT